MQNRSSYIREFNTVDNLVIAFINSLPQVTTVSRGDSCELLVAGTIARVASIQLHIRFAVEQARSRERCVTAANAIVASVQHVRASQLGFIDPIMAVSCYNNIRVFRCSSLPDPPRFCYLLLARSSSPR